MNIPDLADAALMAKRGRESTLYRERKARLEKLRGLMSKFLDLSAQGADASDVAVEIRAAMDEVVELNRMMKA